MTDVSDNPDPLGRRLSALLHDLEAVEVVREGPVRLGAAALAYARRGWPCFPCAPRGKVPLTTHGLLDASTDEAQIRRWWGELYPTANIGVPTGQTGCGLDVIDLDGDEGLTSFEAMEGLPPVRGVAFTPGNPDKGRRPGRHFFIDATGDGNGTSIAPSVDYRGIGGFVLVAPSSGPNGVPYAWLEKPESLW